LPSPARTRQLARPRPGGLLEWLFYIVKATRGDNLATGRTSETFQTSIVDMITTRPIITINPSLDRRSLGKFGREGYAVAASALPRSAVVRGFIFESNEVAACSGNGFSSRLFMRADHSAVGRFSRNVADYSEWKTGAAASRQFLRPSRFSSRP